ncbi:MAG: M20/M25/M40 family metallo-hydrolase [Nitrososphaerales archaeon]
MDKARITDILKQLTAVDGPSGAETAVAALVQKLAGATVTEVRTDALGNLIARRPATVRREDGAASGSVMLAAHMDEIGLIVTRVEQGFLHVARVGGVDPRSTLGQEVTVYPSGPGAEAFPNGLPGYIGSRPPHVLSDEERHKVIPLQDLRVDLGLPPAFFASGVVRAGDRVVWRGPTTELLDGWLATKALDNRASVAVMLGALGYLAAMQHQWDVYAVATVQEEFGLRGATTAAFGVAPDLAIALDVTFGNTPGVSDSETFEMDRGPTIGIGPNLHPGVVKLLKQAAGDLEISYQIEPMYGPTGTDAWAIQVSQEGIPTGLLSVPIRYMHSSVETVAAADLDRTARLLAAFIARLDGETLTGLVEELW